MRLDWFQIDSGWFSNKEQPSNEEWPSNAPPSVEPNKVFHIELSIHETCHYHVGPALWTYHGDLDKPDLDDLKPLRSPAEILGITFDNDCICQMQLLAMDFHWERYCPLLIDEAELHHLHSGGIIALGLS